MNHKFVPLSGLLLLAFVGCASKEEPPASSAAPSAQAPRPSSRAASDSEPSQLVISDDIRKICGISQSETYFSYNSAHVRQEADEVLRKVAVCFTSGPLKGRTLQLVGHTDPRGEVEYNLALGGYRADGVVQRLKDFGLPDSQTLSSSRGELDASGTDEASWANDRRVEMMIASKG